MKWPVKGCWTTQKVKMKCFPPFQRISSQYEGPPVLGAKTITGNFVNSGVIFPSKRDVRWSWLFLQELSFSQELAFSASWTPPTTVITALTSAINQGAWNAKLKYIISKGIILAKFTLNRNSFSQPLSNMRVTAWSSSYWEFAPPPNLPCSPSQPEEMRCQAMDLWDSLKRIPRNFKKEASSGYWGGLPREIMDFLFLNCYASYN